MLSGSDPHGLLAYAESYKQAADAVVETIERTRQGADLMGYAVLFLYRHYVELMLKGLIRMGRRIERGSWDYPRNEHGINKLWQECRPMLERQFPEGDKSATDAVERCVKELCRIDPNGEVSRYPEHKDGRPTVQGDHYFPLRNVRQTMDKIDGFLGGSYDALDELLQHEADVQSELDSYADEG